MHKILQFVLLFMCICIQSNAFQAGTRIIQSPTCILVKINRSENKIASMRERHMEKEINDVIKMDNDLAFAIMEDFKTNFKYCKVYYFDSPSLQDVMSRNWSKVTFYAHDFVHPVIPPDSLLQRFFIIENNYPPPPEYDKIKKDGITILEPKDQKSYLNSNDEFGIVSYDETYTLLPTKICYSRASLISKRIKDKWPKEYTYTYIGALRYDRLLRKYFIKKEG